MEKAVQRARVMAIEMAPAETNSMRIEIEWQPLLTSPLQPLLLTPLQARGVSKQAEPTARMATSLAT